MRVALVVAVLSAAAVSSQAPAAPPTPSLADQIAAAEKRITVGRPQTITAAEAEGAAYPHAASAPYSEPRKCLTIKPDGIVLPESQGSGRNPRDFNLLFGDFFAGSISFGWGPTYEIAKLPLEPLVIDHVGPLLIRVIRIDPPNESTTYEATLRELNFTTPARPFYPSWPRFPTPGKWMAIATAGANWGCFVLDRPVK